MLRKRYNKLSRITMELALIILLPFLGAMLPYAVPAQKQLNITSLVVAVTSISLILLISQAPAVIANVPVRLAIEWLPVLGLNLSFRLDGYHCYLQALFLGLAYSLLF